ncbi:MAG: FAD binding domain-containing protein [Anaerolineaceae bacterium]
MKNDEIRYSRPKSLEILTALISETHGNLHILAGGAYTHPRPDESAHFVDLQDMELDRVERTGDLLRIGATASLQQILDADTGLEELRLPLELEAGANARSSLSLLNFLRSADPRSPFLIALLALAPELEMLPSGKLVSLERSPRVQADNEREFPLWMRLQIPVGFTWEFIARTPKDRPIVCLAAARKKDGSLRIACGGDENPPRVVEQDPKAENLFALVRHAYKASGDVWASAEYRQEMSQVLLSRSLQRLEYHALKKEER